MNKPLTSYTPFQITAHENTNQTVIGDNVIAQENIKLIIVSDDFLTQEKNLLMIRARYEKF